MNLMGADFETPHEFKAGDTISAEMMNELFEYIKNAQKMVKFSDLIGTWGCTISANHTITGDYVGLAMGIDKTYEKLLEENHFKNQKAIIV